VVGTKETLMPKTIQLRMRWNEDGSLSACMEYRDGYHESWQHVDVILYADYRRRSVKWIDRDPATLRFKAEKPLPK
jgi:hypothetical protein